MTNAGCSTASRLHGLARYSSQLSTFPPPSLKSAAIHQPWLRGLWNVSTSMYSKRLLVIIPDSIQGAVWILCKRVCVSTCTCTSGSRYVYVYMFGLRVEHVFTLAIPETTVNHVPPEIINHLLCQNTPILALMLSAVRAAPTAITFPSLITCPDSSRCSQQHELWSLRLS